jgi:hypothetical protein
MNASTGHQTITGGSQPKKEAFNLRNFHAAAWHLIIPDSHRANEFKSLSN